MATMFPREVDAKAQEGEKLVYAQLQKLPADWVVIHDCWQHYRTSGDYVNYEADFIVLVPGLGLATIEVKDWNVPVRIHEGEWQHCHAGIWKGMGRKLSPLNQAFLAGKELMAGLRRRGLFPPKGRYEMRSLAILLNQVPEGLSDPIAADAEIIRHSGDPAVESLYVCGYDALCEGLQERLEKLFVFGNTNMTSELMQAICSFLVPSLLFRLDIAGYAAMMARAAAPIHRLLPMLDGSRGGIRVDGCAGSGKTVMACAEVARLASEWESAGSAGRILLLCFNRNLASALARSPQLAPFTRGEEPRVDVLNLHALCIERYLMPQGRLDLLNTGGGDVLSAAAVNYVAHQLNPAYEAIFVDEAQDIRRDWWEQIIFRLLKPGGRLRIFADVNQNLFRQGNELPDLPTRVTLSSNLRNVRQIGALSSMLLPEENRMELLTLNGPGVNIMPGSDDASERARRVEAVMLTLQQHYGAAPRDIVVLSPWQRANERCSLGLIAGIAAPPPERELPEAVQERHIACRDFDASLSLGDTIRAFKGLEAPFVILTDIPSRAQGERSYFSRNDLYVACTRARFGLIVVPTSEGEAEMRELLSQCAPLIMEA